MSRLRSALAILAAAAAATATVGVLAPAAAETPPAWTAHTIGGPPNLGPVRSQIACADGGFCVVIVGREITTLRHGMVQSKIEAPLPSDAPATAPAYLTDVACVSATSCVAVGAYLPNQSGGRAGAAIAMVHQPLIETYVDGMWTPTRPSDGDLALDEVACNADHCLAVGSETSPPYSPYLFLRSGQTWAEQMVSFPAPIDLLSYPPGYAHAACAASGGACFVSAVATDASTLDAAMYFAYPSGAGYTAVRSPVPAGVDPTTASPGPMACPDATDCTVLAQYVVAPREVGLFAERLVGGALSSSVIDSPVPLVGVSGSDLACPVRERCVAVVGYRPTTHSGNTLLLRLEHGTWQAQRAPKPPGPNPGDYRISLSVACRSGGVCVAAGTTSVSSTSERSGVVWTLSGAGWTVSRPQRSGGLAYTNSTLDEVDCSARVCYASGIAQIGPLAYKPLIAVSPRPSTS